MLVRLLPILAILLSPALSQADTTTGLVGHWPFSGDAMDASGNGNHGAPNGAVQLTADRFGNPDSAYLFDGISSRVDIPNSASLASPTSEITIAAWIRRDGWGLVGFNYNPILTKATGTANAFQYRFIITQSGLGTAFNSWNESGTAPSTYDEGEWYHVASAWSADSLRSYVNGVLIDTSYVPVTITPDANALSIGSDTPGVLEIFLGAIDEVRIYNRALSTADIGELVDYATAAPRVAAGTVILGKAYPNPVQSSTVIPLRLENGAAVSLEVVDARGRRVRALVSSWLSSGEHHVHWDGRDAGGRPVASGIYFYKVRAPGFEASRKVVVAR